MTRRAAWSPSQVSIASLVVGVGVLALGVVTGRADVALIGVPVALAVLIGRAGLPGTGSRAQFVAVGPTEGAGRITETLRVSADPAADVLHVRVWAGGHRPAEVVVPAGRPRELPLRLATLRTGPQATFGAAVRARTAADVVTEPATTVRAPDRLVLPTEGALGRVPVSARLRGLTGPLTARRLGDGTELRDIHPMTPGDTLRRVDWRATARVSPTVETLQVRRTLATGEATAVLVIDSRDDVGPDLHTWRGSEPLRVDEPTSLDLARHAAASVARALVEAGARVGMEDLARGRHPLTPATGHRQLRRVRHALALAAPVGDPLLRVRPPRVPADAIVYLFTTLLDDMAPGLVGQWRERGIPVVVVDTLPAVRPVKESHLRLAWRITSMERADRIRAMRERGVPVVAWGSGAARAATELEVLVRAAAHHGPARAARR